MGQPAGTDLPDAAATRWRHHQRPDRTQATPDLLRYRWRPLHLRPSHLPAEGHLSAHGVHTADPRLRDHHRVYIFGLKDKGETVLDREQGSAWAVPVSSTPAR